MTRHVEEEQSRTIYCVRTAGDIRWFASKEDAEAEASRAGGNVEAVVL